MSRTTTDALWARYRDTGDPEARAELLSQLMGLVHHVVGQIARRVGDAVPHEDLLSAGSLGLVQAFGGYDPARGASFVTYATTRIRGAVLDELRAADWRPRMVRTRAREIEKTTARLRNDLGRPPRPGEIAEKLGVDTDTYWQWRGDVDRGAAISLDDVAASAEGSRLPLADRLPDTRGIPPDRDLEDRERVALVAEAIAHLPAQQRTVLSLCYYEGLTLRQIAEVLHVTESRISQIRTAAIRTLRLRLAEAA